MDTRTKKARTLIAQKLPNLDKLQKLLVFSEHVRGRSLHKTAPEPNATTRELIQYHEELKNKLNELLSTAYITELYLLLLPTLIEIKRSEDS